MLSSNGRFQGGRASFIRKIYWNGEFLQKLIIGLRFEQIKLVSKNVNAQVVGWGYTENKKLADVLQITNLPVASSRECLEEMQAASAFQLLTRSTTFCAGFKNSKSPALVVKFVLWLTTNGN